MSSFNLVSYMLTWSLAELNFGCCANGNTFMFWDAMMPGKRSSHMACQFGKANVWCSFLITYICIIHIMLCGKIIIKSRHFSTFLLSIYRRKGLSMKISFKRWCYNSNNRKSKQVHCAYLIINLQHFKTKSMQIYKVKNGNCNKKKIS